VRRRTSRTAAEEMLPFSRIDAVIGEEVENRLNQVVVGHSRDLAGHDELESRRADIPPHHVDGIRKQFAPGGQYPGVPVHTGM
jgi:hypothetical protein